MFKKQIIPFRNTNNTRTVTKFNYIPHSITTSKDYREYSFSIWKNVYDHPLKNLYSILIDCINMTYDIDIKWENFFDDFCLLIYKRSSKFIFKDDIIEYREREYQKCLD